jgi:type II secretory pathway pseudopilin PulG
MTLIETTIVMIVATAALAAGANMYSDYLNNLTNKAAAQQMNEVSQAFSRYMDDHYSSLVSQVQAGGGLLTVPISSLKPDYLSNDFENRSPFNHQYAFVIRRTSPTSNTLEGLVYTTYSNSNYALKPKEAMHVTRLIGNMGGFTGPTDPQEVISSYGNFDLDLATFGVNPGPGVLISALGVGAASQPGEKYLHRSATGDPAHNRMNTSIDMSGNNLNNADTVNTRAVNATQVASTGVTTTNLDSQNTSAGVLRATQATINGTVTANEASVDGRVTASNFKTSGAFIDPSHNEVAAASVRTNNWFRSYGTTGWYNETYGGGWYMADGTWLRAYSNKSIYTGGNIQADGTVQAGAVNAGSVVSNHYAPEGWGCTPGAIGQYNGSTMSCVDGVWKKADGGGGSMRLCALYCGGRFPNKVGARLIYDDWGPFESFPPGCEGEYKHYGGGGDQTYGRNIPVAFCSK